MGNAKCNTTHILYIYTTMHMHVCWFIVEFASAIFNESIWFIQALTICFIVLLTIKTKHVFKYETKYYWKIYTVIWDRVIIKVRYINRTIWKKILQNSGRSTHLKCVTCMTCKADLSLHRSRSMLFVLELRAKRTPKHSYCFTADFAWRILGACFM
jgi:hypothetical protein